MALNMRRAFNARMFSPLTLYSNQGDGYYNDDNDWISAGNLPRPIKGVILSGNKFSQFDEGKSVRNEDGGTRVSDYKALHVKTEVGIKLGDKLEYAGVYYNVLQQSDEATYGFDSFLLEKSENWTPS